jgi:lysophospholipase L1-like esterase
VTAWSAPQPAESRIWKHGMKMKRRFEPWTVLQRAAAAAGLSVLLAACGGNTSQVESFTPTRLVAFGDEASAFAAGGQKFTVNDAVNGCRALPIWTQVMADGYGFGFDECPVGAGAQKAVSRAAAGATAASLAGQVAAQADLGRGDLVTVLLGANDVKALYAESLTPTSRARDALLADAHSRGVALGQQLSAITDRGARLVVSTVPDLGLSPFGIAAGTAGAALLTSLGLELNRGLRNNLPGTSSTGGDGSKVALVFADDLVKAASADPGSLGLTNASTAACAAALPACTTATLATGADASTWLWADDTWFAYGGHKQLGALALTRARNNPF